MKRLLALGFTFALLTPFAASAHTIAVGVNNAGAPGSVTV